MPFRRSASRLAALAVLAAPSLAAQSTNEGTRAVLTVLPSIRSVTGDVAPGETVSISQWVVPVSASVPLASGIGLRVQTGVAAAGGDVEGLGGLTDTHLDLRAVREAGEGQVVAALRATLPTGPTPTVEQAETAFLVGQPFFGFRAPGAGQGAGLAPSVSWAAPLTPRLAVGAGVSYHLRGTFAPPGSAGDYDPGDEALVTVGADYRLRGGSTLGLDLALVGYGADTWGDVRYETGSALALGAEWDGALGDRPIRLGAQVRRRSGTAPPTAARAGLPAVVPSEIRVHGATRFAFGARTSVGLDVVGRHYAASRTFTAKTLVDLGATPTFAWDAATSLVGRIALTAGDLGGLEISAGVSRTL